MLCLDCVTPQPLKKLIAEQGSVGCCQYCNKEGSAVETKLLFNYIYEMVKENIAMGDDLSAYELGLIYECGADDIDVQTIDIVLMEWFNLGEEPYFDDLVDGVPLEFKIDERGNETHFYIDDGLLERNFYEDKWGKFIEDIRHSHRFFNPNAKQFLDSVFTFLSNDGGELKPECLHFINKGEPLYRARCATTYEEVKKIAADPARQLGPTPKNRASSQRMTPNGISALYCALERETCLSEIRSITGDNVISIAMTPIAQLKLLDLTKLELVEPPMLTKLDKGYLDVRHLKTFTTSLVKKMSKPKGRNDELSYLSTQVVFEYLRLRFGSQVNGLVFPSVQTGERGRNVILFPESSTVSSRNYRNVDGYEIAEAAEPGYVPDAGDPFEAEAYLYCQPGSLRFHKVRSIQTTADEYTQISELFLNDLTRQRLGYI